MCESLYCLTLLVLTRSQPDQRKYGKTSLDPRRELRTNLTLHLENVLGLYHLLPLIQTLSLQSQLIDLDRALTHRREDVEGVIRAMTIERLGNRQKTQIRDMNQAD